MTPLPSHGGAGVRRVIVYSDSASNTRLSNFPWLNPESGQMQLATALMILIFQDTPSACHLHATKTQNNEADMRVAHAMVLSAVRAAAAAVTAAADIQAAFICKLKSGRETQDKEMLNCSGLDRSFCRSRVVAYICKCMYKHTHTLKGSHGD